MLNVDISSRSFEQLLVFETPKDGGDCQLQLSFCKTGWTTSVTEKVSKNDKTYFMPTHCLDPLENETRYRSRGGAPLGRFTSQRSGLNLFASGKMDSFWWMWTDVMPTGV
jgi:hypothetical protein